MDHPCGGVRRLLFPPQLVSPRAGPGPLAGENPGRILTKHAKAPPTNQEVIIQDIRNKSRKIRNLLEGNRRFSPYAAGALMTEKDVTLLSMKSIGITTP